MQPRARERKGDTSMKWFTLFLLAIIVGSAWAYPETDPLDWSGSATKFKQHKDQHGYPYIDEVLTVSTDWEEFYPYFVQRSGGRSVGDTLRFTGIYAVLSCISGSIEVSLISSALVDTTTDANATPSGRGPGNKVTLVEPGSAGYQSWIYDCTIEGFRIRSTSGSDSQFHWTVK